MVLRFTDGVNFLYFKLFNLERALSFYACFASWSDTILYSYLDNFSLEKTIIYHSTLPIIFDGSYFCERENDHAVGTNCSIYCNLYIFIYVNSYALFEFLFTFINSCASGAYFHDKLFVRLWF